MILYAAEHDGLVYGIGHAEATALWDARRSGVPDGEIRYHVVTIEQARRVVNGVKQLEKVLA